MDAFWPRVTKTEGCWLWTGRRAPDGYGLSPAGEGVHRMSWRIHRGPIPDGLQVLHRCDVRNCVNPAHLFLGTNADNVADRDQKGRQAKNENHPRTKLSQRDVFMIRRAYATGLISTSELAGLYGINRAHAYRVAVNKRRQNARYCSDIPAGMPKPEKEKEKIA